MYVWDVAGEWGNEERNTEKRWMRKMRRIWRRVEYLPYPLSCTVVDPENVVGQELRCQSLQDLHVKEVLVTYSDADLRGVEVGLLFDVHICADHGYEKSHIQELRVSDFLSVSWCR